MDQRMPCNRQCMDAGMEIDCLSYIHQEPRVLFGPTENVHPPNILFWGASTSVDRHHLPDHHDNSVPYGMTHYNTFHPPPANFDLGASSVPRISTVPVNYGPSNPMSSYANYLARGAYQDYGRNHFVDGAGGSYKRKTVDSLAENNHLYSNASTSTSSCYVGPMDTRHPSDVGSQHSSASYSIGHYGGGDGSIALGESSSRSVRNRSGVSGINSADGTHSFSNNISQGSYSNSQSFLQGVPFWFDQPSSSNSVEEGVVGWSPPPLMPFMHVSNVGVVPMEIGNQSAQGPHEANGSRSLSGFLNYPYFNPQHYNLPYPSPPIHGIRGGSGNLPFHSRGPVPIHRAPSRNFSHAGSFGASGFRIQWPYSGGIVRERQHNGPHFRISAVDDVAIIDYNEAYGVGTYDHHRDMRLDIEDMSYEELLALGEFIGCVNTGLPEETITSQLKKKKWISSVSINLEELPCEDQEASSCIICQDAYEDRDEIGILDCGHDYHVDCLKKWLLVKNVCPICKCKALPEDLKDQ